MNTALLESPIELPAWCPARMSAADQRLACAQLFANWGSHDRDASQTSNTAGYAGRSFPSKRWEQGGRAHAGPPPGVGRASEKAIDDMFKRENWGRMSGGTRAFGAAFGNKGEGNGRGFQDGDDGEKDDETFGDDAGFDTSHEGVVCFAAHLALKAQLHPALCRMHHGICSVAVLRSLKIATCSASAALIPPSLKRSPCLA